MTSAAAPSQTSTSNDMPSLLISESAHTPPHLRQSETTTETREQENFWEAIKPFTPDALANGFSTLIGALIGATLAYALQRKFQKNIEHKNSLMAAHRLMFSLLQQINTILLIQRDHVYSELGEKGRFLSIPALPPFDTKQNTLTPLDLSFLLESEEGRSVLHEFHIAQENYLETLNAWNIRSELHHNKAQPALANSTIKPGDHVSEEDIKHVLGDQVFHSLINATDNCIELLKRSFRKLEQSKRNTRSYLVKHFKSDDFTDLDYPDTYGLKDTQ